MTDRSDEAGFDGGGYDDDDSDRLPPFTRAVAALEDVQGRRLRGDGEVIERCADDAFGHGRPRKQKVSVGGV